jgi:hypothetical protein
MSTRTRSRCGDGDENVYAASSSRSWSDDHREFKKRQNLLTLAGVVITIGGMTARISGSLVPSHHYRGARRSRRHKSGVSRHMRRLSVIGVEPLAGVIE